MQMRSYSMHQGLLLPMKVRFPILCDSFHSGLMAGLDLCTWTAGGVLNKYPYQPGVKGWTSNSLGCTDIWWQFIYSYGIWNLFHRKMGGRGGAITYPQSACVCILGCSTVFCGFYVVAILLPLSCFWLPGGKKSLKLLKLMFLLASLKMY